uniref:Spermidine/putrescine-binding protein n=1 Tax=Candidatus Kentrum sp. LFY TaxID=2126342 RepID=A0A450UBQ2_9GAMM|nr:MAG: Spermidine/putrescine-binding protein [Candidatus Kentron sp. LFY]
MKKSDTRKTIEVKAEITRRKFLGITAVGMLSACDGPWFHSGKNKMKLRWLGWEHYNVHEITKEFEDEYGVELSAGFFDGNSEAYSKLQGGGVNNFDLVMADGFWPRLYNKKGLTQELDEKYLVNMEHVYPDFMPNSFTLLNNQSNGARIATPNCWGGYGLTSNINKIDEEDANSLSSLFNDKYRGRIATSARYEENIALAGILVCHELGTKDTKRPDGGSFNPYMLHDNELELVKEKLIKQKELLLLRWRDEDTLERVLRNKSVWISPEWSGIYRRIEFDRLDKKERKEFVHSLKPREGGLGWVDSWAITTGVIDTEKLELAHKWIDFRLKRENMKLIAEQVGWAPTVDVRKIVDQKYIDTLFLNSTSDIHDLYQFDAPSSPEKWERIWSEVAAS